MKLKDLIESTESDDSKKLEAIANDISTKIRNIVRKETGVRADYKPGINGNTSDYQMGGLPLVKKGYMFDGVIEYDRFNEDWWVGDSIFDDYPLPEGHVFADGKGIPATWHKSFVDPDDAVKYFEKMLKASKFVKASK